MSNIMNISGVDCYEENGTVYLKLEAVARGLGFTTVAKSGNEVVRWNTVYGYLENLGVATSCNGENYQEKCPDFIPENVFYRLAMKAKNETAEKFQALVADEIIPSIRKHGAYMTPDKLEEVLLNPDMLIKLATELKHEREQRIEAQAQVEAQKPKVLFADAVAASETSILIGDLAKILNQNGANIGQKRLFMWLRDNNYLIKQKGAIYNMPTQKSMDLKLFEIKETVITHADGHTTISKTPKVTGKGQQYFINQFMKV